VPAARYLDPLLLTGLNQSLLFPRQEASALTRKALQGSASAAFLRQV